MSKASEKEINDAISKGRIKLSDLFSFSGINRGDEVIVLNGYDLEVGPFKVLGFDENGEMYLDWDCFWYTVPISRVVRNLRNQ